LEDREEVVIIKNSNNGKNLLDIIKEINGTAIEYSACSAGISRLTAVKPLKELVSDEFVKEYSCGNSRMYISTKQEYPEKVAEKGSDSTTTSRVHQEVLKTAQKPVGDA
jgi:hypothetical protein